MIVTAHCMLTNGDFYRDPGADYFNARPPWPIKANAIRQLQALGYAVTLDSATAYSSGKGPTAVRPREDGRVLVLVTNCLLTSDFVGSMGVMPADSSRRYSPELREREVEMVARSAISTSRIGRRWVGVARLLGLRRRVPRRRSPLKRGNAELRRATRFIGDRQGHRNGPDGLRIRDHADPRRKLRCVRRAAGHD